MTAVLGALAGFFFGLWLFGWAVICAYMFAAGLLTWKSALEALTWPRSFFQIAP